MIFAIAIILFSLSFCAISLKIIKIRRQEKISIGAGESKRLARYIGAQRNFFEYSVVFLLQLLVCEFLLVNLYILAGILAVFAIARILHFISLTKIELNSVKSAKSNFRCRIWGMRITFLAILAESVVIAEKMI